MLHEIYRKELRVGERIPTEFAVLENCTDGTESCDQQSVYDSTSDEEDHQLAEDHEEESESVTPVNFLSKTIRTRSGRAVTCHKEPFHCIQVMF